MAVNKEKPKHSHYTGGASNADKADLSARLAPLEKQKDIAAQQSRNNGGVIVVDAASLKLPAKDMSDEQTTSIFRPDPLALVILIFAAAFIVFIAWQISTMPPPD
jgi:hypothetical protein